MREGSIRLFRKAPGHQECPEAGAADINNALEVHDETRPAGLDQAGQFFAECLGRIAVDAAFDLNDPTVIYAVLGGFNVGPGQTGHVFRTTINGTSWTDISPALDVPFMFGLGFLLGLVIKFFIFAIELFGTVIKSGVLKENFL